MHRHINIAGRLHWKPISGTLQGALQDVRRSAFYNSGVATDTRRL
jgi:hypothetical protein